MQPSKFSEKELKNNLKNEIATLISKRCYNPATRKPPSIDYILSAMKSIKYEPKLTEPAEAQLDRVLKNLQGNEKGISIIRAVDKIELSLPTDIYIKNKTQLMELLINPEISSEGYTTSMLSDIQPGNTNVLYDLSINWTKGKCRPKILSTRQV